MKINFKSALCALILSSSYTTLCALDFKNGLEETLLTEPNIKNSFLEYQSALKDEKSIESQYYPSVDFTSTFARERTEPVNGSSVTLNSFVNSIQATQNLFNGFATKYSLNAANAKVLVAANNYIKNINELANEYSKAYLDVIKARSLVEISKKNVAYTDSVYKKVSKRYELGLISGSDIHRSETSLFLAQSNLVVDKNNLDRAITNLKKIVGKENISINELKILEAEINLPNSLEEVIAEAKKNHPAMIVQDYSIKAALAEKQSLKKSNYPKIDAFIKQNWEDNVSGVKGDENQGSIGLTLNYNLYSGGYDKTQIQKSAIKVSQEKVQKESIERQIKELCEQSWTTKDNLTKQLAFLKQYENSSSKTLELYEKEYDLGRRTLLDVLVAHNDHISSLKQIADTQNTLQLSKYQLLNNMGKLVEYIMGRNTANISSKVGL